ncbi:MAG TPA: hypothetical protein VH640_15065 [Bryobacteraceae bacterium]|jgi:hypothetical protein
MRVSLAVAALVCLAGLGRAQNLTGDWIATLRMGPAEVRVLLHIKKGANSAFKATLDGIDQAIKDVPIGDFNLAASNITFLVPSLRASYKGALSANGEEIAGTWQQGVELPLNFRRLSASLKLTHKPAKPSDIDGAWEGRLEATNGARLVFNLVNTDDGLTATVDSPDQGLKGWPVPVVARTGSTLRLEVKQVGAVYQGVISPDRSAIDGSWGSGGKQWRLVLKRSNPAAQ